MTAAEIKLQTLHYGGQQHREPDLEEAISWFRTAADQGHVDAQIAIAGLYYLGHGVEQDYKQTVKWCKRSAQHGNQEALYHLRGV